MPYLGNTPSQQAFTPATDYFSGNGSTTAFTLSRAVASVNQIEAVIENVVQNPSDAYTVSGNTITFTSAPPSGTNNIYVRYTSLITQVLKPGQGTVGALELTPNVVPQYDANGWLIIGSNWKVKESGGVLYFASGSTNYMKIDGSGNLTVAGNVTAYGTV